MVDVNRPDKGTLAVIFDQLLCGETPLLVVRLSRKRSEQDPTSSAVKIVSPINEWLLTALAAQAILMITTEMLISTSHNLKFRSQNFM